jgi:hypothetical protein
MRVMISLEAFRRDLAALGAVFGRADLLSRGGFRSLAARIGSQCGDGIEQFAAMAKRSDAKLLEVLHRQARKDRFINVILAEGRLVSFETEAP